MFCIYVFEEKLWVIKVKFDSAKESAVVCEGYRSMLVYLNDSLQQVLGNGTLSYMKSIHCGVPQG